jgi:hypothetical protein
MAGLFLAAQDLIYMKAGEQKKVIVKKVGVSTIGYVRWDDQAGALFADALQGQIVRFCTPL